VWATPLKTETISRRFTSLRWRIARFYALLLFGIIAVVAIVLNFQLRAILLDTAKTKVDAIAADISRQVRGASALNAIGAALPPEEELTLPGSLDHWASPSTYVEIDNADGYQEGKSTNMGGARFDPSPQPRPSAVVYKVERTPFGEMFVRDELLRPPGSALVVKVGEGLAVSDEALARMRVLLALVAVLAALVGGAASYAIASTAIDPIDRLIAAMREITSERLDRRLGWKNRSDEIGTLAATFDAMLDRLEESFARERQFISDASHELKTPLTVINANAQMLERWADEDPVLRAESLQAIRDESLSLAGMVNGMLLLAKAESGEGIPREPVELDAIVGEAVRLRAPRAEEKALSLTFRSEAGRTLVLGDANLLRQLFTNLIDNAIKFTQAGRIDVGLRTEDGRATVDVSDTGIGIDESTLGRVFDRFYRTDASRDRAVPGTGLGLAIVRSIARVHDGSVEARRNLEGGTTLRITLPTLTSLS
jgi:two-component system sensor histidine kinase ArlS